MKKETVKIAGQPFEVLSVNSVVVGTGAAGYNAADRLFDYGQQDVIMVTEGIQMGTSRNTGSDKQTYYKLSLSGNASDSVAALAEALFNGGAMDGDLALCEAALSVQCFFKLVEAGVPFPHNMVGEYVGYRTDHDPMARASSAGPLTSKFMTERLQDRVGTKKIPVLDGYRVIKILKSDGACRGVLCLNIKNTEDLHKRYLIVNAVNTVYAVGAPAGLYESSVYPVSQTGSSGIAFEAGVKGKNLTEWQYGIAAIDFRWNLSGSYQQVLPRYISVNPDGTDEREFLIDYFPDDASLLQAIFLKGYQWPFDVKKLESFGSSCIDLAVYQETVVKNRIVYLDYRCNPSSLSTDFSNLDDEAFEYLKKSDALLPTPVARLKSMNIRAFELFRSNGIDLEKNLLRIAVCAQHNNGGLSGDCNWESNLPHFFPVGEVNGSHGIVRPGGSALNSGQVGGTRAAQYISQKYTDAVPSLSPEMINIVKEVVRSADQLKIVPGASNINHKMNQLRARMSQYASILRNKEQLTKLLTHIEEELGQFWNTAVIDDVRELPKVFSYYDLLCCQYVYISAFLDYITQGGGSRGSYLIEQTGQSITNEFWKNTLPVIMVDEKFTKKIQESEWKDGVVSFKWRDVRPIPNPERWFEQVWKQYCRKGEG